MIYSQMKTIFILVWIASLSESISVYYNGSVVFQFGGAYEESVLSVKLRIQLQTAIPVKYMRFRPAEPQNNSYYSKYYANNYKLDYLLNYHVDIL